VQGPNERALLTLGPDTPDPDLLSRARLGEQKAYDALAAPYLRPIHRHCYRMLGSPHDAHDALQETLLAAWRGLGSYDGRGPFAAWLYRISTSICLRMISKRPRRLLSEDHGPAARSTDDLGEWLTGRAWVEPYPDQDSPHEGSVEGNPFDRLARRETVTLAFVAALQHLPGTQRAALLLRDVLEFSAVEAAALLDVSVATVTSALQRARVKIKERHGGC
jgi:RNA polymerase sigma-70 factor (TIGR02960 family)